ncbi:heme exporter protein B [Salinibacter ruber]|jgi:heme exporter protein B|nr:heme exporter protein CcmB [Salinibacter ruber]MBB4061213.1 heme exporter protein B [Salinibacter ruber]MBB4069337.1 heme exporter protein B [Salinibacter ruber]MBB4088423.1 heme exporter protein B [Salinibacter ruber]MCS3611100.1 heme exporter protein B [Salinibacter ruber]MCS3626439.1 heme exporter protein B [Salinibacter ruber]
MDWLAGAWSVFRKDLRTELRSRYAANTLLLFALAALLLVAFAVGPQPLSARVRAALLWIVLLFAASIGLGRSFVAEHEGGTALLLRLHTRASMVFAGKLLFNFGLVALLTLVATGVFLLLLGVSVGTPSLFAGTLAIGALGLTGATTLLSALVARASRGGPLLPVLLLPVLVPVLVSGVGATRKALLGQRWVAAQDELLTLVGFAGATLSAAVVLFDYVWAE